MQQSIYRLDKKSFKYQEKILYFGNIVIIIVSKRIFCLHFLNKLLKPILKLS